MPDFAITAVKLSILRCKAFLLVHIDLELTSFTEVIYFTAVALAGDCVSLGMVVYELVVGAPCFAFSNFHAIGVNILLHGGSWWVCASRLFKLKAMTNYQLGEFAVRFTVGGRNFNHSISVPRTVLSIKLLALFLKQGLIQTFTIKLNSIDVKLKYCHKKPLIKSLILVSTPGHRVYWTRGQLSKRYNAHNFGGFYIVSTSGGLYTSNECLTISGEGGEVIYKLTLN